MIRMSEIFFRSMKGFLMGALFGVFLLGIFFELLITLPVLWVLNRILGPQHYRMQWTIRILVSMWLFLLRGCGLLKVKELKGKPFDGPCVIVSNHPGLFDVLLLIRDIPRMSVMVKQALARKLPLGPVFRSAGYVLSPDFEQRGPFQSLDEAIERIRMGFKFMIFPEATRSPKGELGRFNAGPFILARLSNVPLQPLFVRNDPPFLPKEDKWYFPPSRVSTLEIEFWEPMAPPQAGQEREFARDLEARYREALGLISETKSTLSPGNEMEHNQLPAEPLIPHRLRMRLIDWVKRPTQNGLQAETIVTGEWPLCNNGEVSSILCIELVAQAIAALSTWRRGEGAGPRLGLLAGIKEAEFSKSSVPVGTRLNIQINELSHVGDYAVFEGKVRSDLDSFCKIIIQVMEPEEEALSNLKTRQRI
jgi:1-acyl-sn-glycerol-3-phosphate acyltransferase